MNQKIQLVLKKKKKKEKEKRKKISGYLLIRISRVYSPGARQGLDVHIFWSTGGNLMLLYVFWCAESIFQGHFSRLPGREVFRLIVNYHFVIKNIKI